MNIDNLVANVLQAQADYHSARRLLLAQIEEAKQPYIDASQILVDEAKTFEEIARAYRLAPKGTTARWNAYRKGVELANTLDMLCEIRYQWGERGACPGIEYGKKEPGYAWQPEELVRTKFQEMVIEKILSASSLNDLIEIHSRSRVSLFTYETKVMLMDKTLSLFTSVKELQDAYQSLSRIFRDDEYYEFDSKYRIRKQELEAG